ncbi:MAG TPA: M28 family peptidase [Polyangia bacterium]|nr:M28 family peptidase [Polyangia bacterium]
MLERLAAIGPKRAGTTSAREAAELIRTRMEQLGLSGVHFEEFAFPRRDLAASSLEVTLEGAPAAALAHDVLDGSASGRVDADVVWVGAASARELAGRDVRARIALVTRHPLLHRSAQYASVAAAGAAAMLYVSTAPDNLRQVGSVRSGWEAAGPIPALTLGARDGERLAEARAAGRRVEAHIEVHASTSRAAGRNVLGEIIGRDRHTIVVGAHYDTWFAGATDNGAGVAAVLALAERFRARPQPRYCLRFVAYDGEELALYGGYDFLRRHGGDPILVVLNLESPAAKGASVHGLAHSEQPALDQALRAAGLDRQYETYLGMELVPQLFGGAIPTDVQGAYRAGFSTASTAVDSPFYHTSADTPDQVDLPRLAASVDGFERLLDQLLAQELAAFAAADPGVWRLQVEASAGALRVRVSDSAGVAQAGAQVEATLLEHGFFQAAVSRTQTDDTGWARVVFDRPGHPRADSLVHIAAGRAYPLAEVLIQPQPNAP